MLTIPRPEFPRPDMERDAWLNLNGEWGFAFDDDDRGLLERWYLHSESLPQRILVPFCYQCKESGVYDEAYHPVVWYQRSFTVPATLRSGRLLLCFGAVDYRCRVYVNGRYLGCHEGGYTPFSLEITDEIINGDNRLTLRVEDRRSCAQPRGKQYWKDGSYTCWYTPVTGIWQTVYLLAVGQTYIHTAHVRPDIDRGIAELSLALDHEPSQPIEACFTVTGADRVVCRQTQFIRAQYSRVLFDMVDTTDRHSFEKWSPEHPFLYDLTIELKGMDRVQTYFGMRKVEVRNGTVLLNNQPLTQRLVLDQGYWSATLLTPPSDQAIKDDILLCKRFGFNGARKHQKLEDPRYYYWADRLGLLVWGELPSCYCFNGATVRRLSETLTDFIERDFNHPSLIVWVPLNESWGVDRIYANPRMQAAGEMLYHQAKALDGTRLVDTNDGWEQVHTDIWGLHDYAADGETLLRHFADRDQLALNAVDRRMSVAQGVTLTGREALMLTEYGGVAVAQDGDQTWGYHDKAVDAAALTKRFGDLTRAAQEIPGCQGYCYTQLTDVFQEANGLCDMNRTPKVDPDVIARLNLTASGESNLTAER